MPFMYFYRIIQGVPENALFFVIRSQNIMDVHWEKRMYFAIKSNNIMDVH